MRGRTHEITVCLPTTVATDAEGYSTQAFDETKVHGRVAVLHSREILTAAQRGVHAIIQVRVPVGIRVEAAAEVVVVGTGDLGLDGRYRVEEVRPNPGMQHLLCSRYAVPERASSARR